MPAARQTTSFGVTPPRPYSLALTVERLVRFDQVLDRFEDGVYRRLLWVAGAGLLVSVRQEGPPSRAELEVRLAGRQARSPAARLAAERLVGRALGADSGVRAFYRACGEDPVLGSSIRANRGLRVAGGSSVFETLLTAVFAQQVNLAFAYSIRKELCLALGRRARFDGESYLAFPTPASVAGLSHEELRAFRLTNAKARALHEISQAFHTGELSESQLEALPDEEVIDRLTALRGVGRWTAEVTLMRGLARPDAFPAGDLAVVKHFAQQLLGRESAASEQEMREFSERWKPHRALALVYAYAEMARRSKVEPPPKRKRRAAPTKRSGRRGTKA